MLNQEGLDSVVDRAASAASGPAKLLIFGSYARGDATEDSDLDLLVIEPSFVDKAEEYVRIRSAIGRLDIGVDLLLYTEEEFARRSAVPGTLPYWAKREGRLVHERSA
jgi:predicted nucleotidyltransferase